MLLDVIVSEANLRREPSSASGAASVIATVPRGTQVTQIAPARGQVDWLEVQTADGQRSFIKRMLLAQAHAGAVGPVEPALLSSYNTEVWRASEAHEAVTYKLGAKDPRDGQVDCSGWIAFVNMLAFGAVNAVAGRRLFTPAMLRLLNTHSDHQVSMPGYRIGQIFSGPALDEVDRRPGLLIGINFSDYAWERGQNRVFEIDHIVLTVAAPSGVLYVTQSSSSGGGVNRVKLDGWLAGTRTLAGDYRLHAVDLFGLLSAEPMARPDDEDPGLEMPELDISRTPAG
ncbi:hypothetical protein ACLBXM_11005 [Xanthobacteraceae bacterium A53D]